MKLDQDMVTVLVGMPLSIEDGMEPAGTVAEKLKLSVPVKERSTSAAALEKVEWPLVYSAKGGVGRKGRHSVPFMLTVPWLGFQARMVSSSLSQRTAVMGRMEL